MITDSKFLDGMIVFCKVAESGNFTAAAMNMGISASHVSKEIKRLEHRLGTRLINRTTRTFSLTGAGEQYYQNAKLIVANAIDTENQIIVIDVSRDWLDIHCLPDGDRYQLPNTCDGHEQLVTFNPVI